jgi:hypothetical protein
VILPGALAVGPQRTGTTWVHEYLSARGDVCLPDGVKETFFFDSRFDSGLEWYASHFRQCAETRVVAEVAPTYFHCPAAPERIHTHLGRVPIVCTLRDPAERTFSLYLHMRRRGATRLDFPSAVEQYPQLLDSSRYATHLARWQEVFGAEGVLVLLLDDLAASPETYVARLCRHLGLPVMPVPAALQNAVNAAAVPPHPWLASVVKSVADRLRARRLYGPIALAKRLRLREAVFGQPGERPIPRLADDDRRRVVDRLTPEIEALERLLGTDLAAWKR